ncbi:hypothetical protein FGG39_gp10 [Mycobacterium phage Saintus]|uniref:Uncharacterized protein n=1 Tax=Mycobacterium phage Saintus TaxID=2923007 RepID=G8IRH5_9CAUD|nr:hypothetical protein FGG39_gp10 [Mycobacterium phage Saintus]AER26475.1 hypothetical protein SAINTUS_92 [Mycobacterium phage Saintus]
MRHVLSFEHDGTGEGAWQYQVMALDAVGKVQLWFQARFIGEPPGDWAIGHSKEIPADLSAESAADIMRDFITGAIDHYEYNALLPW